MEREFEMSNPVIYMTQNNRVNFWYYKKLDRTYVDIQKLLVNRERSSMRRMKKETRDSCGDS